MRSRAFILQRRLRLDRGRPVVELFGRLESGETFLVRDGRIQPCLYVRARDGERLASTGAVPPPEPTDRRAFRTGEPLLRLPVERPADVATLRERFHRAGIYTYEGDVRLATRYLLERGVRSSAWIEGAPRPGRGVDLVFDEPELSPCRWAPELRILSFDIETDPRARRLLSIGLAGCGAEEVLLLTPQGFECPPGALPFEGEAGLLEAFCRRVRELDPDVLTGWNVIDFDLKVLDLVARRVGVPLTLGRGGGELYLRRQRSGRQSLEATIPGRLVLDGPRLARASFVFFEEGSLDAVSRQVLGEGKVSLDPHALDPGSSGRNRGELILEQFHRDRKRFVEYNLKDARLVLQILDRLGLVELAVERSLLTGLPPDRVASSVAAFDFLYLSELTARGMAAPSTTSPEVPEAAGSGGGHVLEPAPGLWRNVLVFDFQSLYPSIIRTFQVDPLGWVPEAGEAGQASTADLVVAPNGAAFRRQQGILPAILDELFPRRAEAVARGDAVASKAIKILMNSFYGVLGTRACRFHHTALANAITGFGRELLLWTKGLLEEGGLRVLYGDTDSLFVLSGEEDPPAARRLAGDLRESLNRRLAEHVAERWGVESRLRLDFEELYLQLVLLPMRGSSAGARKRYVGLVDREGEKKVVFTGMEAVRRDWTDLARRIQREIYERLFLGRSVEAYLRREVAALRAGERDAELVYRKALRKSLGAYTSTSPPHVVAARRMKAKPGRLIRYVITGGGPEPASEHASGQGGALDYEHYVEKQVRPVAEPVLRLLELDFAKVIGDDRQLELF